MSVASRSTLVVHGRLAMRDRRLTAARDGRHGLQVMSFEQAAVRLAGGFARPLDDESLRAAIQAALPTTPMGELESIKSLPGMIDAAADTLYKAWRAGIDLAVRAADHPRLDAIARLETAVLDQLPPGMMRPVDIVAAATSRIAHAPAVIGPDRTLALLAAAPEGAHRAYSRAMDGRAKDRARLAGGYRRQRFACTSRVAAARRRQRSDGLSRGH